MPAPFTIVVLVDEDGDEFPVRLPGVYRTNQESDIEAAIQIVNESAEMRPTGALTFSRVEYV